MTDFADISSWQATADFSVYQHAGYNTISLKATEGGAYVDPPFKERWRWAASLGLTRWAYHFAQPGNAVADANHFISTINSAGGLLPTDRLMLDFESVNWQNSGTWTDARQYAIDWCNQVRALVGPEQPMLIYSYHDYEQNSHVVRSDLPNVGLALASYGSSYSVPPGWDHICLWQFTDGVNGQVVNFPGIGNVDGNRQLCDLHDCSSVEDELNDADWARLEGIVKQAVSDGVKAELTLLAGKRNTPPTNPSTEPTTLADILDAVWVSYHGIQGDPTHPGLVPLFSDTNSRIANIQSGAVDPAAIVAAVKAAGLKIEGTVG